MSLCSVSNGVFIQGCVNSSATEPSIISSPHPPAAWAIFVFSWCLCSCLVLQHPHRQSMLSHFKSLVSSCVSPCHLWLFCFSSGTSNIVGQNTTIASSVSFRNSVQLKCLRDSLSTIPSSSLAGFGGYSQWQASFGQLLPCVPSCLCWAMQCLVLSSSAVAGGSFVWVIDSSNHCCLQPARLCSQPLPASSRSVQIISIAFCLQLDLISPSSLTNLILLNVSRHIHQLHSSSGALLKVSSAR